MAGVGRDLCGSSSPTLRTSLPTTPHPLQGLPDLLEMLGQLPTGLESTKEQHSSKETTTGHLHIAIRAQPARRTPSSGARSCSTRACGHRRTRGDPREEDGAATPTPRRRGRRRSRRCRCRAGLLAGVAPSCCHSALCFPLKRGHSNDARTDPRRQEYLGSPPARSSLPPHPPRRVQIRRKRNLQHTLTRLHARARRHLQIPPASPSAWGRSRVPKNRSIIK